MPPAPACPAPSSAQPDVRPWIEHRGPSGPLTLCEGDGRRQDTQRLWAAANGRRNPLFTMPMVGLATFQSAAFGDPVRQPFGSAGGPSSFLIARRATIPDAAWAGLPVGPNTSFSQSYQRVGGQDHQNAADWKCQPDHRHGEQRIAPPICRRPTAAACPAGVHLLTQGEWTGLVTVLDPGTNVWLRADDGAGHAGAGGMFSQS